MTQQATLSGCIDIIVIKHPDGTLKASPFHVRFGKLKLLKSKNQIVRISVNGKEIQHISMVIDGEGEAFFVRREVNIDCKSCGHHEVEQHEVKQVAEVKPSGPKSAHNLTITQELIVP